MDTLDLEPVQERGERVNVIVININMSIEITNIIIVMIVLISNELNQVTKIVTAFQERFETETLSV